MQKLTTKLQNVPRNAPLVPCSTILGLNRVKRLSDQEGSEVNSNKNELIVNNNDLEVDLPVLKSSGTKLESLVL
jgi:hypothetical protein